MEYHRPVLLKETIDILDLQPGETYFDCTLGNGGHAEEVWRRFGKEVTIAGIDADAEAAEISQERLELAGAKPKITVRNFRNIGRAIELLEVGKPQAILFDLGWNTRQFEESGRGFSFDKDEPLLMTFGEAEQAKFTAEEIVNEWEEENLRTIISAYGEEDFAGRIAKAIVERREEKRIKTARELAELIKKAVPVWYRFKKIHPATKTFQALRIAVNEELQALEEGLQGAFDELASGGRIAVIAFHSLEDRIVKNFFKALAQRQQAQILTKKPFSPSEEEIAGNRRSRSAKLRAIKKLT